MSRTLLIAFDPGEAGSLAGFGAAIGQAYDLLVLRGSGPAATGAERVLLAQWEETPPADATAAALAQTAAGYTHIAAVSSMQSKDAMARMAGLLDAAMVTDVVEVLSPDRFRRPIVAGTLVATVETLHSPTVFTVRASAFADPGGAAVATDAATLQFSGSTLRVASSAGAASRPDLSQAKVVVSGGRPLKDAETFERLIGGLADRLSGAVGATRAAVDSGIAPNECQVGQTGKFVAPDLYIAAGISGSTQHMAGIKDSKIIVAINTDPDAPIFESADLGLVQDLYLAIPELISKIKK